MASSSLLRIALLALASSFLGCPAAADEDALPPGTFVGIGFKPSNLAGELRAEGLLRDFVCRRADSELSAQAFTSCAGDAQVVPFTQADGTQIDVFFVRSLRVDQTADVILRGDRPIAFVAFGAIEVFGTLRVLAGGYSGLATSQSDGEGPGGGVRGAASGAGGGFCGRGGASSDGGAGGTTYGDDALTPLVGGSSGAGGDGTAAEGGSGGGAIQLVAATAISVTGVINAGGVAGKRSAGGGAGGAILLEAPSVDVSGTLAANGGGGAGGLDGQSALSSGDPARGGGGGGAGSSAGQPDGASGANGGGGGGGGRIRINTDSGDASVSGTLSPSGRGCSTRGTLAR